jgi:hypothetical protein
MRQRPAARFISFANVATLQVLEPGVLMKAVLKELVLNIKYLNIQISG